MEVVANGSFKKVLHINMACPILLKSSEKKYSKMVKNIKNLALDDRNVSGLANVSLRL